MRALGRTVYRRLEWYEREFGLEIPLVEDGVPLECGFLDVDAAIEWCAVHPATIGWVGIGPLRRSFRRHHTS